MGPIVISGRISGASCAANFNRRVVGVLAPSELFVLPWLRVVTNDIRAVTRTGVAPVHIARCLGRALVERLFQAAPQNSVFGHALLQVPKGDYRIRRSTRRGPRPCTLDATACVQHPLGESLQQRSRSLRDRLGTVSVAVTSLHRRSPRAPPAVCRGAICPIRRNAKRSSPTGPSWVGRFPPHHFEPDRVGDAGRHLQCDHAEVADVFPTASGVVAIRGSGPHGLACPFRALPPQFGHELVRMPDHPSMRTS